MFIKVITQVAIFFAIYLAVSWWQMSQLLSDNIAMDLAPESRHLVESVAVKFPQEAVEDLLSTQNVLVKKPIDDFTLNTNAGYFSLPSSMDDMVDISASGKPTLLYFFAPWCKICHLSIDNIQDFYVSNPDVDIIAIALDYKSQKEVTDFTLSHQLTFPVVYGDYKVKKHFKIFAYPSYYFLDPQNNIKKRSVGYSSSIGLYFSRLFI